MIEVKYNSYDLKKIEFELNELINEKEKIIDDVRQKFKIWNKLFQIRDLLYAKGKDESTIYLEKIPKAIEEIRIILNEVEEEYEKFINKED